MDGTLYYSRPVKIVMGMMLLLKCPRKERKIVLAYRRLHRQGTRHNKRVEILSNKYFKTIAEVQEIIDRWMIEKPSQLLYKYRDKDLISKLNLLQKQGKKVIVLSDYPVKTKLKALKFYPSMEYSGEELGCLKPNPEGIKRIFQQEGIEEESCIIVGDCRATDGKLAENAGIDQLIIARTRIGRGIKRILNSGVRPKRKSP